MNERDFWGVDLNLLVVLLVLTRERNVTRAAEALSLGQPAVSAALRRLRTLTDDPLFVRTGRGMVPTPRAERMAREVAPLLEGIAGALAGDGRFDPATASGTFALGMPDDLQSFVLPPLLGRLQREAPGLRLVVRQTDLHRAEAMLASGEMDLGLSYFGPLPPWARRRRITEIGYSCIFDGARLGIESPIDAQSYLALPHLLVSFDGSLHGDVDRMLAERGLERTILMATTSFAALPYLLREVRAVATLPEFAARTLARPSGLSVSPLPFPIPPFTESLAWHGRNDADAAHVYLRDLIEECFREALAASP